MFWKVRVEDGPEAFDGAPDGRFVVHRHVDADGEHLDLRLECDGHLRGWRIDARDFEGESWATEKPPHPVRWIEDDGDAVRLDAGVYAWERSGADGGALVLHGGGGCRRVVVSRAAALPAAEARTIADAIRACDLEPSQAAGLIADGVAARSRAIERLCGLGRELDGEAFDEPLWRKSLSGLALDEIHGQLRSFEVRFDVKYPPRPVSRPDALGDEYGASRADEALDIVRG